MKKLINILVNISCKLYQTIQYWVIDILIRLRASKRPLQVILGAGGDSQPGWLATDISHLDMLSDQDWRKYFKESSIDALFAEHVWEHLDEADGVTAAKNCYSYLRPGGYIRIAVPDGFHPSSEYLDFVKPMGSGLGSEDHMVLFTYVSLTKIFETVGFTVELLEYFDESGKFHHKNWNSEAGLVTRSKEHDERNKDGNMNYTSIILDCWKKVEL